jgi:hypothetical protein
MARFHSISEAEIGDLLSGQDSKSTQRTIKRSVNTFRSFLNENDQDEQFEMFEKLKLNEQLRLFLASIKKKGKNTDEDGGMYKKNAYVSLRYGLARYIKKEMGHDIVEDAAFATSQDVFHAMCQKLKKSGLGGTEHYPPIASEDLKRLYNGTHHALNVTTPVGLQKKVWFEIILYLCKRGRENQREMRKDTFVVACDASGREFVCQDIDESDKNHGASDTPDDTIGEARMYAIPGRKHIFYGP